MRALRGWDKRDTTRSVAAWLYRIARNAAYDELRHRRLIAFVPLNADSDWRIDDDRTPENAGERAGASTPCPGAASTILSRAAGTA